ncbi:SIR2 family NAD-dependent protein deacylase [Aureitalea marina]|uniref:NAD-dependent protein deacylase n=1 Tax=Aureitalea marina TaxID=930804 RepID=A0A2S7KPR1_9FLAO|nr:NAD-dependent deacylase [Aureitalea marina]PQB04568.1 NAD-dependent protein deacylase [Aureitalea marina]
MKIVVLSGAGMSAESGLKTFRDSNGLWEGHDVMEVASPQGFARNPDMVLDFYNERRRQLLQVEPNSGHFALAELEQDHEVEIVTQNVDDLHERAGSSRVTHLHGELLKVRSTRDPSIVKEWRKDIVMGDLCPVGAQLRPHIVWFGEAVPLMDKAIDIVQKAEVMLVVGTSMQVYPAAGLVDLSPYTTPVYFIDPNPALDSSSRITVIAKTATHGIPEAIKLIGQIDAQ